MNAATCRLGHVLILLPSTGFGGTERHTAQLAAQLGSQAGLRVSLAAEAALLPALRRALPPGLPTPHQTAPHLLAAPSGWQAALDPADAADRQYAVAKRLIADLAPDILLLPLPWPNAGLGIMRAAAEAALPRLVVVHLAPDDQAPAGLEAALPGLGAGSAAWCAVSAPGARRAERFFRLPPGRVAQIDNPAPPPPLGDPALLRAVMRGALGLHADAPLLLFLGRLDRAKGAHLLPALARNCAMTLACGGAGPLRATLDRQAAADPQGWLRMLGHLDDPAPWYLAADALVLPSALEGLPLVFLEAAAAGCPVVATEAALEGLGEAAPDLARLVPDQDPGRFAKAVRDLIADRHEAGAMAERARAEASGRSWSLILPQWLGLLRAAASPVAIPDATACASEPSLTEHQP